MDGQKPQKRFRPALLSSLVALTLFVTLISLGVWQVERLHWKTQLLADINQRMAATPTPLPATLDHPGDWEYRRVTLAGHFDYNHEFLVKPRTLEGRAGYDMIVPFDRVSGGTVLVDRGWVSDEVMGKVARPADPVMQIEGVIQQPKKSMFTPDNDPARNDWYWIDAGAMAKAAGLPAVAPVVVSISERKDGVWPAGGRVHTDIPNDHRQYAVFWFAMAGVLFGIWFLSHWHPARPGERHAGL